MSASAAVRPQSLPLWRISKQKQVEAGVRGWRRTKKRRERGEEEEEEEEEEEAGAQCGYNERLSKRLRWERQQKLLPVRLQRWRWQRH